MSLSLSDLLRALLAAPARAVDDLRGLSDTAQELPGLLRQLLEGVRSLDRRVSTTSTDVSSIPQGLAELRADIVAVGAGLLRLEESVGSLDSRLTTVQATIDGLLLTVPGLQEDLNGVRQDVHEAVRRLPDPDQPGPLARVRDALVPDAHPNPS
jgi:chromosome segregation ATPase